MCMLSCVGSKFCTAFSVISVVRVGIIISISCISPIIARIIVLGSRFVANEGQQQDESESENQSARHFG